MNMNILSPEVQRYLQANLSTDPAQLALQKSPFAGVSAAELATQLDGKQRCRHKLPLWHGTPGIIYPEKLSLEQASSETTASYKSGLISKGDHLIDLTGGLGIDSYHFSNVAGHVVHCEQNEILAEIAAHNAVVLGAKNIDFVASDGMAFLDNQAVGLVDCIYIDPSRRVNHQKVFLLSDCLPDVVKWQDTLLRKAPKVIIKTAPMLDISSALSQLQGMSEVHIISVDNECKELLFVLERQYSGPPSITAVALHGSAVKKFLFDQGDEEQAVSMFSKPKSYLYEPDAALLKSGAFKLIGQRYGLKKLHQHTHLYTDDALQSDFPGRVFRITESQTYAAFKKDKQQLKANVSTRNFPLKPEQIRKKHRIEDGGDSYLFFCTDMANELLVIFTSKS